MDSFQSHFLIKKQRIHATLQHISHSPRNCQERKKLGAGNFLEMNFVEKLVIEIGICL